MLAEGSSATQKEKPHSERKGWQLGSSLTAVPGRVEESRGQGGEMIDNMSS